MSKDREKGLSVGFNSFQATVSLAAAKIEEAVKLNRKDVNIRITMVKHLSDVNVKISDVAWRAHQQEKENQGR